MKKTATMRLINKEDMLKISCGRVDKVDTINYRNGKLCDRGLFSLRIFGPNKDFECECGKYKGSRCINVICEKCNVEVTYNSVRRDRMGHIELGEKVIHPWYFRSHNNRISFVLGMQNKELQQIANFEKYLVFEKGTSEFNVGTTIDVELYDRYEKLSGFIAESGPDAIHRLLCEFNMDAKMEQLKNSTDLKEKKLLRLLESMKKNGIQPQDMVMDTILVLPPSLRPLVSLNGKIVSSAINNLYRCLLYRIERLHQMRENDIKIPLIYRNERRILQDAINNLFGSGGESIVKSKNNQEAHSSIMDRLKGKEGMRKYALGKRVDYSGRSVIVPSADLKLDECYLPKEMAMELYRQSIIHFLIKYGFAQNRQVANKMINEDAPEAYECLGDAIQKNRYVLLNRAPTLHRLSIEAFKIKVWSEKAIGLHPLVCHSYNADFDGDQMAVFLLLSQDAISEGMHLMMATKNTKSATHGNLTIGAYRDISFGLYVLTKSNNNKTGKIFNNIFQIENQLYLKKIQLNDEITYIIDGKSHETTVGRALFWECIPKNTLTFANINVTLTAKVIQSILLQLRKFCEDMVGGEDARVTNEQNVVTFADKMKDLGFKYAYEYTGSIGLEDFLDLENKEDSEKFQKCQQKYSKWLKDGLITKHEKKNKILLEWQNLYVSMMKRLNSFLDAPLNQNGDFVKFLVMFAFREAGSRGSGEQMAKILSHVGQVIDSDGDDCYVINSYVDGLSPSELIHTTPNARSSIIALALKTAGAGHMTRKLVDTSNSLVITTVDCKTDKYLVAKHVFREGVLQDSVYTRIFGRVTALSIYYPNSKKILVPKDVLIDEDVLKLLKKEEITEIPVRSPTLCESSDGICMACYGADLSSGYFANLGEPVGVIAAQSIGEPGTQLTMKLFHKGGVDVKVKITKLVTPFAGTVYYQDDGVLHLNIDRVIKHNMKMVLKNKNNLILAEFDIPYGAILKVKNGETIDSLVTLAEWSLDKQIICEFEGICTLENLHMGLNCETLVDEDTGIKRFVVTKHRITPVLVLKGENNVMNFPLQEHTVLEINHGDSVKVGQILAYTPFVVSHVDITGSLEKITDLFENRDPKNMCVLAPFDGIVFIQKDKRGKNILKLVAESIKKEKSIDDLIKGEDYVEIPIEGLFPTVYNEQKIKRGDRLTVGYPSFQDLLDKLGIEELIEYFLREVQFIYLNEGIEINHKHFEVMLRQMCSRFELSDGRIIDRRELFSQSEFKNEKNYRQLIHGITAIAIQSTSFLSSISFQSTIQQIVNAGIAGRVDPLYGLKENVLLNNLIPCGTGFIFNEIIKQAQIRKARTLQAAQLDK